MIRTQTGGSPGGSEPIDWDELTAHIAMCTGWSWDTIDRKMDLIRFAAMSRYWDRHPPLQIMVQSYLGIKPVVRSSASRQSETDNTEQYVQEFAEMFSASTL